jgi:Domain of unknown function (DUF4440)
MTKIRGTLAMAIGLVLAPFWQTAQESRNACIQRCVAEPAGDDPEMQRQEIVSLEREAARAIQLNNGTFFRRIYSDNFTGTLSHGQVVDKQKFIEAVQNPLIRYDSFIATDIRVRIDQETAIATCAWTARGVFRERRFSSQMRLLHVYVNGQSGWRLVASQATHLPPDSEDPL